MIHLVIAVLVEQMLIVLYAVMVTKDKLTEHVNLAKLINIQVILYLSIIDITHR